MSEPLTDEQLVQKIKSIVPFGGMMKVSEVAKKIKVKRSVITDLVEGYANGLDLIVGVKTNGGISSYKSSDYLIEHYE